MLHKLRRFCKVLLREFVRSNAGLLVHVFYGDIWKLRDTCCVKKNVFKLFLYNSYFEHFGAFIGLNAVFEGIPVFPHGFFGIFISNSAHIGKDVVIFQQVTIGSNMLNGSKRKGAPYVGNNVYIGPSVCIVEKVKIWNNTSIGAGAVVLKDVPENCTVAGVPAKIISKEKKNVINNPFQYEDRICN